MSYLAFQSQHNLSSPPGQGRGPHFAGSPDFRLLFDLGLMAGSETDDLAEELFVNVAEYVRHRLTAHG